MSKDFSAYRDVKAPTSLIMSGVESDMYWDIAVAAGFDRLLVSYHYIQKKGKRWLRERMQKHPNVKLMIDSGAYTFHVNVEEYKNKPVSFFEEYVRKYTEWVKDNKDIIFSCVEVDIANIVGFDKVDDFRKNYFEPLKDEGILVCYVWHEFDGKPHWEEMCVKYDYVGFSLQTSNLNEAEIMKMMNIARRYGAIVHGFALTRVEIMSKLPFFTGDSTTWLVGTQYGELNWFDGRRMRRLKKKDWKTVYKQKYIKLGANWDLAGQENPYELIRINALVFKQAEVYIRKRIRAKMYWMKGAVGNSPAKIGIRRKPTVKQEPIEVEVSENQPKPKKKLIKKKKATAVAPPLPEQTPVVVKHEIMASTRAGDLAPPDVDRPKTKFELFQELSAAPEEQKVFPLDEQIGRLPAMSWFDTDGDNWKEVAEGIRFNASGMDKDEFMDIVYNFCIFLRDKEKLADFEDEELFSVYKLLFNRATDSLETAIAELTDYYAKNLTGERKDLLVDDSGISDEAPPRPTERESYLEDEEYGFVEMTNEEMANLLPEPKEGEEMPEIEELDRELARQGIVAVRDEQGRFLKGQKRVRKPKQVWSKHFPKLACNTCYKAGECPEYLPDHACAFDKVFKKFKTRNMDDLMDAMFGMADLNMERMSRLALFESMDGGMPDPTLTAMIDQNLSIAMKMQQLHDARAQIVATQRKTLHADGREETITSVNNPSGGILAQIFGAPSKPSNDIDEDEVIDASYTESE